MKTTTCDVCGATVANNYKWAYTTVENYQLHSLTGEPLCIASRTLDLCPDCTENCMRWLHENVKPQEEVAG